MTGGAYPFLSEDYIPDQGIFFTFFSQGIQVIPKAIAFTRIEKSGNRYYNWGFGDLVVDAETGEFSIDDTTESNNGDVRTIFYTVVSTLPIFFDMHPDATVYIKGSNQQRNAVYKRLIMRNWPQIEPEYIVSGVRDEVLEAFRPNIEYDYLLIARKKM